MQGASRGPAVTGPVPSKGLGDGLGSRHLHSRLRFELVPCVLGVAPAVSEFQVDAHRHFELHRFAAEPRDQLALLARRDRAFERVVHLQQRHDAFAPAGAHPQLGVACGVALDQRVERGVGAVTL